MKTSIINFRPASYVPVLVDHKVAKQVPATINPSSLTRAMVEYGEIAPVAYVDGQLRYGQAKHLVRTSQLFLDLVEDLDAGQGIMVGLDRGDQDIVLIDEDGLKVVLEYAYLCVYLAGHKVQQFEVQKQGVLLRMEPNEFGPMVSLYY
jgi:hypothetical protein